MATVTITFTDEADAPEGGEVVETKCGYGDLDKKNPTRAQRLARKVMAAIRREMFGGETLSSQDVP